MNYNEEIESYGYKILDNVEVVRSNVKFNCKDSQGYKYYITLWNLRTNKEPRLFNSNNPYAVFNIHNWLKLHNLSITLLTENYINSKIHMKWRCDLCGHEFNRTWERLQISKGCSKCYFQDKSKETNHNQRIANYGYKLLDSVDIYKTDTKFNCQDDVGYKYYIPFDRLRANKKPCPFHSCNPHVINNIYNFLKINNISISLISTNYIDSETNMKWRCNICNDEFERNWESFIVRPKCTKCSFKKRSEDKTLSQEEVIEQFKTIHGDKYDYSLVVYEHGDKPISIICPFHGKFSTTANTHKHSDCPLCGFLKTGWVKHEWIKSALKSKRFSGFKLYIIQCYNDNEIFYKIGRTYLDINLRFSNSKCMPYNYKIIYMLEDKNGEYIHDLETNLLRLHYQSKLEYMPEIEFGGKHECFKEILDINEILLDFNNTICNI